MSVFDQYLNHISHLKQRIQAQEVATAKIIPKDLFLKLKFKEYTKDSDNIITFIDTTKPKSLDSRYELED